MSLEDYARNELKLLGSGDDPMQAEMNKDIMQVIKLFGSQGHSGFSAGYAIGAIEKLLQFQPLTPLTGDDDEWHEVGEGLLQNNRCPSVFKDENGTYDINAIIVHYGGGDRIYSTRITYCIKFPYVCGKQLRLDLPASAIDWSNEEQTAYIREHRDDSEDMTEIAKHLDIQ